MVLLVSYRDIRQCVQDTRFAISELHGRSDSDPTFLRHTGP
jgi:hypothetical protein